MSVPGARHSAHRAWLHEAVPPRIVEGSWALPLHPHSLATRTLGERFARSPEARGHRPDRNAEQRRDFGSRQLFEFDENEHFTQVEGHPLENEIERCASLVREKNLFGSGRFVGNTLQRIRFKRGRRRISAPNFRSDAKSDAVEKTTFLTDANDIELSCGNEEHLLGCVVR